MAQPPRSRRGALFGDAQHLRGEVIDRRREERHAEVSDARPEEAVAASFAQYMNVKANSHTDADTAMAKNAPATRDTRRTRTLVPKTKISAAVTSVGTANGEKP